MTPDEVEARRCAWGSRVRIRGDRLAVATLSANRSLIADRSPSTGTSRVRISWQKLAWMPPAVGERRGETGAGPFSGGGGGGGAPTRPPPGRRGKNPPRPRGGPPWGGATPAPRAGGGAPP